MHTDEVDQRVTPPPASPGLCLGCNYDLQGLAEPRCPECGRPFDPADPRTVNPGRPLNPFARWALRPAKFLSGPSVAASATLVVASGWAAAGPALLLLVVAYLVVAVPHTIRSALRGLVVRVYRQPREMLRVDDRARRISRVAFASAAVLLYFRVPLYLTFLLSRPALDRYAVHVLEEIPASDPPPTPPRWMGVYRVRGTFASPAQVGIRTAGGVTFIRGSNESARYNRGTYELFGHWHAAERW